VDYWEGSKLVIDSVKRGYLEEISRNEGYRVHVQTMAKKFI
jgi:hypothetical protein